MSYTQPLEHLYETDRLVVPIPTTDQAAAHASFSVKDSRGQEVRQDLRDQNQMVLEWNGEDWMFLSGM